jgi:hypothetical protein
MKQLQLQLPEARIDAPLLEELCLQIVIRGREVRLACRRVPLQRFAETPHFPIRESFDSEVAADGDEAQWHPVVGIADSKPIDE